MIFYWSAQACLLLLLAQITDGLYRMVNMKLIFPLSPADKQAELGNNWAAISALTLQALGGRREAACDLPFPGRGLRDASLLPDPRCMGLGTSPEPDKDACGFTCEFKLTQLQVSHGLLCFFSLAQGFAGSTAVLEEERAAQF